jgi:hypothetical protein
MAGESSGDAKRAPEKLVAAPGPSKKADARRKDARERQEARRKAYDRNRRQWLITKVVAGVLVLAIVGGFIAYIINWSNSKNDGKIPSGVINYTYTSGQHNDLYNSWTENPPVGGVHNNVWQNCGYYADPIGTGHGVHSLEHGAVWITYQPDLPADQIAKLKDLADSQNYLLVSPFPGIPSPIVVTAWGHQMQVQTASDPRINQFIKAFKNSQTNPPPEPGALCSNGTSINGAQSTQTAEADYTQTAVAPKATTAAVTPTP